MARLSAFAEIATLTTNSPSTLRQSPPKGGFCRAREWNQIDKLSARIFGDSRSGLVTHNSCRLSPISRLSGFPSLLLSDWLTQPARPAPAPWGLGRVVRVARPNKKAPRFLSSFGGLCSLMEPTPQNITCQVRKGLRQNNRTVIGQHAPREKWHEKTDLLCPS